MRQRVSFLRSLLAGKPVLALDEPFASLDAITRAEMQGWLAHVLELEPRTVVLVTHDVEEAVVLGDRVVVMSPRPGRAVAEIERRRCPARGVAPTPRSSLCASGRCEALGVERMRTRCWAGWRAALLLLVLLGAWELYVDLGGADPLILPAPHAVAQALYTDRSLLWSNFLVTAEEVLLGILVAAVGGLAFAIAIHFFATLRRAVYPLLSPRRRCRSRCSRRCSCCGWGSGSCPSCGDRAGVVLLDRRSRRSAGFAAVDPDLLKLMRTFDASRLRTFRHVELPSALPGLFTGAEDRGRRGRDRRRARPSRRAPTPGSAMCSIAVDPAAADARARTPRS